MIIILSILGFFLLLISVYFLLRDFSRFIWKRTIRLSFRGGFVDLGEHFLTAFTVVFLAILGLLFYKFATAFVAYIFSDNLISFFTILRGVFTIKNQVQNPFLLENLIAGLLLTPALQFITCYFIYRGIRVFMFSINKYYSDTIYSESDVLYFGFLSSAVFIFLEIVFYSQYIPSISGMAHLTYLTVSRLSFVCYFLAIAHIHLLRNENYKAILPTYVHLSKMEQTIVYSPLKIVILTYFISVVLFIPFVTGTQFLNNNWLLILIYLISCSIFYLLLRTFLSNGFNYLGVVMLVESPARLLPGDNLFKPQTSKTIILGISLLILILGIMKPKLFILIFFCAFVAAILYLVFHSIVYLTGFIISIIRTGSKNEQLPTIRPVAIITYLFATGKSAFKGGVSMIIFIVFVFILLSFFPKHFENKNNEYVQSVFDEANCPVFIEFSENNGSLPVPVGAIPEFFLKCLYIQEDRGFLNQNSWFPQKSNWHGISLATFYRFYQGGGGSNLNMQLIKNVSFPKSFPQDVQRKFSETLAAYQLSLQCSPEKIETDYLNEVGLNGGIGNSGIMAASLYTFGLPISELNSLEMLYLVTTLKRGSRLKIDSTYLDYNYVGLHSGEIKQSLLKEANSWYQQNLITKREFNAIKEGELRFTNKPYRVVSETTTREFFKRQLKETNLHGTTYKSSISLENQQRIGKAVKDFELRFQPYRKNRDLNLYSSALVINVATGQIIGHYGGDEGVTDLTQFAGGSPLGSVIKPFILLELLEQGNSAGNVRLFDGPIKGKFTPNNYNRKYSRRFIGIDELLKKSLNAPMVNIREITDALNLYKRVEDQFAAMNISKDYFLNLDDPKRKQENIINYPLGSRNMTLFEIAQAYQTLFNNGNYVRLSAFSSVFDPYRDTVENNIPLQRQIFSERNTKIITSALKGVMQSGGTGFHITSLLPKDVVFFGKTGTTDGAKHGYTVLCDGRILIVAHVTYGKITGNHLSLGLAPIPYESGGRSAGVLAALIYDQLMSKN